MLNAFADDVAVTAPAVNDSFPFRTCAPLLPVTWSVHEPFCVHCDEKMFPLPCVVHEMVTFAAERHGRDHRLAVDQELHRDRERPGDRAVLVRRREHVGRVGVRVLQLEARGDRARRGKAGGGHAAATHAGTRGAAGAAAVAAAEAARETAAGPARRPAASTAEAASATGEAARQPAGEATAATEAAAATEATASGSTATGPATTRRATAGSAAAGIAATGIAATGIAATGIAATGITATGFTATGFTATGFTATGITATGIAATGITTTGITTTGITTAGVTTAGITAAGEAAPAREVGGHEPASAARVEAGPATAATAPAGRGPAEPATEPAAVGLAPPGGRSALVERRRERVLADGQPAARVRARGRVPVRRQLPADAGRPDRVAMHLTGQGRERDVLGRGPVGSLHADTRAGRLVPELEDVLADTRGRESLALQRREERVVLGEPGRVLARHDDVERHALAALELHRDLRAGGGVEQHAVALSTQLRRATALALDLRGGDVAALPHRRCADGHAVDAGLADAERTEPHLGCRHAGAAPSPRGSGCGRRGPG